VDLSIIDTPTLQGWYTQALNNYAASRSGGRPISASYTQGDGSKSVAFNTTSWAEIQAWVSQLQKELQCRGVLPQSCRRSRRAIGFVYGGNGRGVW
jgi:hypothetical protein